MPLLPPILGLRMKIHRTRRNFTSKCSTLRLCVDNPKLRVFPRHAALWKRGSAQTLKITDFLGNPAVHSQKQTMPLQIQSRTNRIVRMVFPVLTGTNSPTSVSVCALTGLIGQECLTAPAEKIILTNKCLLS